MSGSVPAFWITFQFHSGSIKSNPPVILQGQRIPRFNSIVVRLKGIPYIAVVAGKTPFQFHSGSIKRLCGCRKCVQHATFQFHSGSIKRTGTALKSRPAIASFNSIVVRLKEERQAKQERERASFNSIVVRLKGTP